MGMFHLKRDSRGHNPVYVEEQLDQLDQVKIPKQIALLEARALLQAHSKSKLLVPGGVPERAGQNAVRASGGGHPPAQNTDVETMDVVPSRQCP